MVTDMVSLCPPLITRTLPRRAEPFLVSKPPGELFVVVFPLILEKTVFIMGDVKKKKNGTKSKKKKTKITPNLKTPKHTPNNFDVFSSKIFVRTCLCPCMCVYIFYKVKVCTPKWGYKVNLFHFSKSNC